MEFVEDEGILGQNVHHSLYEGRRHIEARRRELLCPTPMSGQVVGKGFESRRISSFRHKEDLTLIGIGHQSLIGLPPLTRGLVNSDRLHAGQVRVTGFLILYGIFLSRYL